MEFRLLGPVELTVAGEPIRFGRPQERCLLAILLLELGRVVPVARLVELLWDGEPPERARSIVQTHVSRVRATLRKLGSERYGVALLTRGPGYAMSAPGECVDAHRFQRLVREAHASEDPAHRARLLQSALLLWRGPPLADVATERVREQVSAGLVELHAAALEDRAEAELALGRHRELVTELTDLVARYPQRERLVGLLMLALYRSGQQARALATYRQARQVLVEELGIEPTPFLRQLERAILAQDPTLDLRAARPVPSRTAGLWRGPRSRLTSIVGRDAEVAQLTTLLADHRLVTVLGAAGVGKTTLVLHAAEALASRGPQEVAVATLGSARGYDEIVLGIGSLLGVTGGDVAEVLAGVERYVADHAVLLVLDNCEHLLRDCAIVVRRLLSASPRLVVLTTSRQPLDLPEETVWRLEPLRPPAADTPVERDVPAVALFLRRAREALPGFLPTEVDLDAAGRICRRVDGLPLALELAAGRLRTLTVDQLASQLEEGFGLLADTLTETLNWSFRLLTEKEQRLFARLSVFRDGFTVDAAQQVCSTPPLSHEAVLPTLQALVERSLVQPDSSHARRYRLLEVVRDYAAARLVALGEATVTADQYLHHWLDRARAIAARTVMDDQFRGWVELQLELSNLRGAMDHAYAVGNISEAVELTILLFDYFLLYCSYADIERWLERAQPHLAECSPELRGVALFNHAVLQTDRGDYVGALALIRSALDDLRMHRPLVLIEAQISAVRCQVALLHPAAPADAASLFADLNGVSDRHLMMHGLAMYAEALLVWGRYDDAAELLGHYGGWKEPPGPANAARYHAMRCLAAVGRGRLDEAAAAERLMREQVDRPGNFLHLVTPSQVFAIRALQTLPADEARGVIAQLIARLNDRYPPMLSTTYGLHVLLAESERRAGEVTQAFVHLVAALRQAVTRSDYALTMPGVVVAASLAADVGDSAASRDLADRWNRLRRKLGLPAPLGLCGSVATLGLDPNAPAEPEGAYRWDERELRDLLRRALRWCAHQQAAHVA